MNRANSKANDNNKEHIDFIKIIEMEIIIIVMIKMMIIMMNFITIAIALPFLLVAIHQEYQYLFAE